MNAIHVLNKRKPNAPEGKKRDNVGLIHANSRTVLPTDLLWNKDSVYLK